MYGMEEGGNKIGKTSTDLSFGSGRKNQWQVQQYKASW